MSNDNVMQAIIDGLNAAAQDERRTQQWTLGDLIEALASLPADNPVQRLCDAHSYRGYYCDIAFETDNTMSSAAEVLSTVREANGESFEGYKGGTYWMSKGTPVWISDYGCCGFAIIGINEDGTFATRDDDE